MANSKNDGELLTIQILRTPAGRKVLEVFIRELFTTMDVMKSVDRAKEAAQRKGVLLPLQISLVLDFLIRVLGPLIIAQLQSRKK